MLRVVASRVIQSAVLLLLISVATFGLLRLTPGDPGALLYGPNATAANLAQLRERWGLDAPLPAQYLRWLGNAATGDLGRSYADGRPVLAVIAERTPSTLLLAGAALLLATLLGIGAGVLAATHRYSWVDRLVTLVATILYSTPPFWLGLLLILLFSLGLGWLPSGGMRSDPNGTDWGDLLRHLALPASALALRDAGRFARVTRASMLEALEQDYVRTASAKGLRGAVVATRHVLRNALLPVITLLGMAVPGLLGGAVVIETVFSWPGLGRLAIESALQRNYPVVMGEVLIVATLALVGSLLADLAYSVADPRVGRSNGG
ncbi:MAG: ABC transporter permease [Chloroflexota bacterium]